MHTRCFVSDLFGALSTCIGGPDVFRRLMFCVSNATRIWIAEFCCLCSLLVRLLKFSDFCSFSSLKDPKRSAVFPQSAGAPSVRLWSFTRAPRPSAGSVPWVQRREPLQRRRPPGRIGRPQPPFPRFVPGDQARSAPHR